MRSMDLFQYERKVRVYNIAKQICNVFSKFLGVKETVPQLKKHLEEEVEELLSAKNKKEMAFECADVIILCMRILIVSGYKDPLAIIDQKGKIVLNRLEKAVGIQMRTPGLDGREAYRLAKQLKGGDLLEKKSQKQRFCIQQRKPFAKFRKIQIQNLNKTLCSVLWC